MAASLPRYGLNRERPAIPVRRGAVHIDVTMAIPTETLALARRHFTLPGDHERRPNFAYDLCVRKTSVEQRELLN